MLPFGPRGRFRVLGRFELAVMQEHHVEQRVARGGPVCLSRRGQVAERHPLAVDGVPDIGMHRARQFTEC